MVIFIVVKLNVVVMWSRWYD